ncbi:MAG: hypothetical protein ETSY2_03560 [Candidatus Entotheonella gemina]|uniref:non-specific protein-tyrosine kinase n=2 Tax=Candidatus Entotheonella TaxID=93171 RepID=W4MFR1_9BACT|nr:MAG: hypothetical protein ETSY2_03560 [Candidatus Entotheonella gemina]
MAANMNGQPESPWRDSGTSVDVVAYLKVLRKRKWMILIPLLVVLPLSALVLLIQHPSYEATAILLIEPANPRVVKIEEVHTPDHSREYYKSQYALLKSEGLLGRVVDTLSNGAPVTPAPSDTDSLAELIDRLKTRAKEAVQRLRETLGDPSPVVAFDPQEVVRRERIGKLQRSIRVEPVGMRLVHVTIVNPDPRRATTQVNTLAETYVAQNLEAKLSASEQASIWLEDKVQELRAELQQSEAALQAFIAEHKLVPAGLNDKPLVAVEEFKNLTAAYATYKADQVALQAQRRELAQLRKQPFDKLLASVASQMNSPLVDALRQRYAELQVEHGVLLENFKPRHPKVLAVESRMQTVQERITGEIDKYADQLKSENALIAQKVRMFGGRINNKKGEIIASNEDLEAYSSLKRDIDAKRRLYENLLNRMNETEVTKSLETNNVRLYQRAAVPVQPVPQRTLLKFLISAMVVLSFGVGMAFAAEMIDNRFKNLDDVEHYLRIPFLGLIPSYSNKHLSGLVTIEEPRSAVADSYRILRTNLQMMATQRQIASLMITSAVAGEGKTTTSANLGVSFAQLGWKVLIIDADLRRPALYKQFSVTNEAGLSDVLSHQADVDNLIQNTGVHNLRILTSGPIPPNPAELLNAHRLRQLCEHLQAQFDLIIFDCAITLSIPDTLLMASGIGGLCLVHNPDRGEKGGVETAKKMLERANANILGIMFNNVRLKTSTYGDYHYYSSEYTVSQYKKIQS